MEIVGHDFQCENFDVEFLGYIMNDLFQPASDASHKNPPSSFGTPNKMIVKQIDVMFSSFVFHVDSVASSTYKGQAFFQLICRHSSPRLKSGAFWRQNCNQFP